MSPIPVHRDFQSSRHSAPAAPRDYDPFDGVLVVDKPSGPTSHDIVDHLRKRFGFAKVGHGGTLDPMATGVLVLLLGRGTKLSNRFLGSDKTYSGTLTLGLTTDSLDATGEPVERRDATGVSREALAVAMAALLGDQMQEPPMVSAVKVKGVPLYKHARRGVVVERQSKLVHIYEFSLDRFESPEADFVVRCTKGTYVRKLCADVGELLHCGAHLSALRRTHSGEFTLQEALPLPRILAMERTELLNHIIPMKRFNSLGKRIPG